MWTASKKYGALKIYVNDGTGKVDYAKKEQEDGRALAWTTRYPYERTSSYYDGPVLCSNLQNCAGKYTLAELEQKSIIWD